jgi:cytochrome P450
MPAFSYRHIKDLYPTFWSKSREVTEAMTAAINTKSEGNEDSSVLEVGGWASRVTLDIIGVAGMGQDFNAIKDPNSELNKCYRAIFQATGAARILQLLSVFIPMSFLARLPLKRNRDVNAARALIRNVCLRLIADKKEKMEKGVATDRDILSVAIESGGFSDDDLVNQLMTFLAAGHETTASAMMWMCYLLCRHPEIQKKLRDAIRADLPSIGDESLTPTAADVDNCAYLHAVCNEVLRISPSVPMTIRVAAHDTTILDHPIPKDTTIIISPWAINVNKKLWGPDADEFNPDRWMGQGAANTGGADSNYSFLTFLHGPRSCIGQAFAKAEFACLVAAWMGKFEMEFADKNYQLKIGSGLTSKPKGGLKVRLTTVEGW